MAALNSSAIYTMADELNAAVKGHGPVDRNLIRGIATQLALRAEGIKESEKQTAGLEEDCAFYRKGLKEILHVLGPEDVTFECSGLATEAHEALEITRRTLKETR